MKREILLRIPFAIPVDPPLPTQGKYARGYPLGAVVHFTAGAYGLSELELARTTNRTYLLIDEKGQTHQGFALDRWGSHAGASEWPSLGKGVSRHLVGIEVDCAGLLSGSEREGFKTWWKKDVPQEMVRKVEREGNRAAGAYHRFTDSQEEALRRVLLWLKANNPEVFDLELVLGHDEVSPGRKQDPGGSLSVTMDGLRSRLQEDWRLALQSPLLLSRLLSREKPRTTLA